METENFVGIISTNEYAWYCPIFTELETPIKIITGMLGRSVVVTENIGYPY